MAGKAQSQSKSQVQNLELMLVVNLEVNIWTARRKLSPGDFQHAELPPKELASLGSKKICDPRALQVFDRIKTQGQDMLNNLGVRFLGGWAIPESRSADVTGKLDSLASQFESAKVAFLDRYDTTISEWILANPQWGPMISGSTVSREHVERRLGFAWQMYRVVSPKSPVIPPESRAGLDKAMSTLGGTLFSEIAKGAQEMYRDRLSGRTSIAHDTLNPLWVLRDKLSGLSFVDPLAQPAVTLIDSVLGKLPKKGSLAGGNLLMVQGLVSMLGDPEATLRYSREVQSGAAVDGILLQIGTLAKAPGDETPVEAPGVEEAPVEDVHDMDCLLGAHVVVKSAPAVPTTPSMDSGGLW